MERARTLKILWRFWVADLRVLSCVIPSVLLFPVRLGTLLNRFPHFSSPLLTGSSCEVFNDSVVLLSQSLLKQVHICINLASGSFRLPEPGGDVYRGVRIGPQKACVISEKQNKRKIYV